MVCANWRYNHEGKFQFLVYKITNSYFQLSIGEVVVNSNLVQNINWTLITESPFGAEDVDNEVKNACTWVAKIKAFVACIYRGIYIYFSEIPRHWSAACRSSINGRLHACLLISWFSPRNMTRNIISLWHFFSAENHSPCNVSERFIWYWWELWRGSKILQFGKINKLQKTLICDLS